jgi:hypothetical protein
MPCYFFNVEDGVSIPDLNGTELRSLDDARVEAVRRSGELLAENVNGFWEGGPWRMDVKDDWGLILFILHFFAEEPHIGAPTAAGFHAHG